MNPSQKIIHMDRKFSAKAHHFDHKAKPSYSEYIIFNNRNARIQKYLSPHRKDIIKLQDQDNKKLMDRLHSINERKNQFGVPEGDVQDKVKSIRQISSKVQKNIRQKSLQHENDFIINKIAKARSKNLSHQGLYLELSTSRSPSPTLKKSNTSLLLPPINPETSFEGLLDIS